MLNWLLLFTKKAFVLIMDIVLKHKDNLQANQETALSFLDKEVWVLLNQ